MPTLKPKLAKECNLPNAQDFFVNFEIVDLKPSSEKPAKVWMSFTAPLVLGTDLEGELRNPTQINFCDFASSGNTWGEDSRYRVWIPTTLNVMKTDYKANGSWLNLQCSHVIIATLME